MLKQITLRGFDRRIERKIREVATRENVSLNKAALRLIERGATAEEKPEAGEKIGRSLDKFFGDMSHEEAKQLRESLKVFNVIDDEDWK